MSFYYFLSVPLFISVHLSWTWRGGRKRRKPKLMNLSRWNFSRALPTTWLGPVTYHYHLFAGNYLWRIATFCRPTNISVSLNLFSPVLSLRFAKGEGTNRWLGELWIMLFLYHSPGDVLHCLNMPWDSAELAFTVSLTHSAFHLCSCCDLLAVVSCSPCRENWRN